MVVCLPKARTGNLTEIFVARERLWKHPLLGNGLCPSHDRRNRHARSRRRVVGSDVFWTVSSRGYLHNRSHWLAVEFVSGSAGSQSEKGGPWAWTANDGQRESGVLRRWFRCAVRES